MSGSAQEVTLEGAAASQGKGKGKGKAKGPPPKKLTGEAAEKAKAEREAKNREKLEKDRERLQKQKEREAAKRDLAARLPSLLPMPIDVVNWAEAQLGLHLVGGKGGSEWIPGGVTVMEFSGGRALCLRKTSDLFPSELVADRVAQALRVRVARHRLLDPTCDEEEYNRMDEGTKRINQLFEETGEEFAASALERLKGMGDMDEYERVKIMYDRHNKKGTYAVLEFVPGAALDASPMTLTSPSEDVLLSLGRICALDLLINNHDRLPLPLWDNAGNLTNVMVSTSGEVVGIDQQANAAKDEGARVRYLDRVRSLVRQLFGAASREERRHSPAGLCERLGAAVEAACGAKLSATNLATICAGLRNGLAEAAAALNSGALAAALDAAVLEAGRRVTYWADQGQLPDPAEEARRVADFVLKIAQDVAAVVPKAKE